MNLSNLKSHTTRKSQKRVGRGGKKGTYSGKGTKGQKARAGAGIRPGFRGGDNRLWQLFPKQRGASHKPGGAGNNRPHKKHRYFQFRAKGYTVVNLENLNNVPAGQVVNPEFLIKEGYVNDSKKIKVLGDGSFNKKLTFEGLKFSKSAREKVLKIGGTINE